MKPKKDYKLSKKEYKPKPTLYYRCPYCGYDMRQNIYPTTGNFCHLWFCDECKKTFELSLKEIIPLKKDKKYFVHKGKRYYKNKRDILKARKKGDRIYYDPLLSGYYIVRLKRESFWGRIGKW